MIRENSKSNHLGAQGTFNPFVFPLFFFSGWRQSTRTAVRSSTRFGSQFSVYGLKSPYYHLLIHACIEQKGTRLLPKEVSTFFLSHIYVHRCALVHQIRVVVPHVCAPSLSVFYINAHISYSNPCLFRFLFFLQRLETISG